MEQEGAPGEPTPEALARRVSDPAFLGALCHDLRGPLGAIGNWLHVLGSGRADAATQQRALAAMERDVATETRLIEQLADLASILAGTLILRVEEVDLASLLKQVGSSLETKDESPRVLADAMRLRQVLAILLPAAEGTPPADPKLLTADHDASGLLVIRGRTRKGGPGLVASTLARALCEVQGGRLTLSTAAEGTLFAIGLPFAKPHAREGR